MSELLKYNGTSDPNEHVTAYTCSVKSNDMKDDEIESVLSKKPGEMLSKGAMMWYHNMAPNSINSFSMLVDSFVKAHIGAIKVAMRKAHVFKIKKRENEILREFISCFRTELMELPQVSDDWAVQAFTQGLNERSSAASRQLKENLVEYPIVSWSDIHNRYQSKIRVEDDQLGAPSGSVHPSRLLAKESKSNKDRYQSYPKYRRNIPRCNPPRNERMVNQKQNPSGFISLGGFDEDTRSARAPHLSVYKSNIDEPDIMLIFSKTRDTGWPRPILSNPS
ncbi:uncharacterized protein LOC107793426 [Nicotiana tabacum]|uniref:Uncharacterized protein LOC107793426 n=1 Tax=Nicotiana tabacum TaxID=4097 RepID=A0AC58STN3_TOBAC